MRTRTFLLSSLSLAVLAACSPTPTATLSVTPESISATAGDAGTALEAKVENSSAEVNWKLAGDGTLSATKGAKVTYTPPATFNNVSAVITASLSDTALTKTINVTLKPKPVAPTLEIIAPSKPIVFNTAAVVFNAQLTGSTEKVKWSLEPAGAGSIDPAEGLTTLYTPPVGGAAEQSVTLKAKAGALEKSVMFKVVLPTLTVTPATTSVDADATPIFTATLNNSDSLNGVQWVLEGVGALKAPTTGSSVQYLAPAAATVTTEQTAKLTAKLRDGVTSVLEFKVKPTLKFVLLTPDKTTPALGETIKIKVVRTNLDAVTPITDLTQTPANTGDFGFIDGATLSFKINTRVAADTPLNLGIKIGGVSGTTTLTLKPSSITLPVAPANLKAGDAAFNITATRVNLDSSKAITFSIPAGAVGTLTQTGDVATYTPPSSVAVDPTKVTITAKTGDTPNDVVSTLELTIKPKPVVP